jgi:hypothetical protein
MRRRRARLGAWPSARAGDGPGRDPVPEWSRRKMLALLVGAAGLAVLLAAGVLAAVAAAVHGGHGGTAVQSSSAEGRAATGAEGALARTESSPSVGAAATGDGAAPTRAAGDTAAEDNLAAAAMPEVGEEAAHPAPVSLDDPGAPIVLPAATSTGAAGVPTGFPETPQGAMAQLAAVDAAVLQAGSLTAARSVALGWIAPGGPSPVTWSPLQALGELFDSARLSGGGSPRLHVTLTPLMGQVKGVVGTGFVVPCVDFELDVTLVQSDRGATADCQRMAWTGSRWEIGVGAEPAPAPSVWPDTDTALSVGYKDLSRG